MGAGVWGPAAAVPDSYETICDRLVERSEKHGRKMACSFGVPAASRKSVAKQVKDDEKPFLQAQ